MKFKLKRPSACPDAPAAHVSGRTRRWLRLGYAGTSVILLAGVMSVAVSSPSWASATGCTGFGNKITISGVSERNMEWCGTINGSGLHVNYVTGYFYFNYYPQTVCNFRELADFYDSSGHYYGYVQSAENDSCWPSYYFSKMPINKTLKTGYVLMHLQSNGTTLATVQESIH